MGTDTDTRNCPGLNCNKPTREYLCHGCAHRAERALGDLPSLTRDLEQVTVTRLARVVHGSTGRNREPDQDWRGSDHALAQQPAPADVTASDRGREILELLFEWADAVAAVYGDKGLPLFSRAKPLTELVGQAVAILLRRSEWLRLDEQGPVLAEAIHFTRRDLRRLVDTRPMRLYAGPCQADLGYPPEMGYDCRQALYRAWGRDDVPCDGYKPQPKKDEHVYTGCGRVHLAVDRDEFMVTAVEDHLLPLRLLWASLHLLVPGADVDWKTAQQWTRERRDRVQDGARIRVRVTPPRLEPAAIDRDGLELYRGADVLRLARDESRRRGRKRTRMSDRERKISA